MDFKILNGGFVLHFTTFKDNSWQEVLLELKSTVYIVMSLCIVMILNLVMSLYNC